MGWRNAAWVTRWRGEWSSLWVRKPAVSAIATAGLGIALLVVALLGVIPALGAQAAPEWGVQPTAPCETLAGLDATSTNGKTWGRTIMPGHGAPGGWFGVDVCENGFNTSAPNGANVSCDRVPDNWAKTGCAPGHATSDGYGLTFQCVELIIRFSSWAYGDPVSDWGRSGNGNAPDLWLPQNHPSDFVMYPNGSSYAPVPGDILVWGNLDARGQPLPAGFDGEHGGHIAVVAAVRNSKVITAEQNVKWGTEDHPSDTLALTKVGSRWILSGSARPETRLPTYRWQPTMGNTRATYGWLHSIKNHGTFPSTKAPVTRPPAHSTPSVTAPAQKSGGLPSLAGGMVVTNDGTLADLVWSQTSPFTSAGASAPPAAELRNLGAPPGSRLAAGQSPAVVQLSDDVRYSYAIGADGHLYLGRTSTGLLGIWWSDLGAPGAISLAGSAAASSYAGGVAVAAVGSDGNLWWRAGPASSPGGWQRIGHPDSTQLAGSIALAGAPGNGAPLLLALGTDGRLYERIWQPAILAGDGSVQVPAGWSMWVTIHAQPAGVQLTGKLVVVPEAANPDGSVGSWQDTPLDIVMSDSEGKVWWLRSTSFASGWVLTTVPEAAPVPTLIAGVAVPAQSAGAQAPAVSQLVLYAMTAKAPYEAQISLPAHPHDLISAPSWTRLASLPAGMTTSVVGTALSLGSGESTLLVPQAASALVGGTSSSTSMLVSFDTANVSSTVDSTNAWVALGTLATAPAFSDPLKSTSVNAQWVASGNGAAITDSASGLRLVPGSDGTSALLQGADPGDASLTVRVSLPSIESEVSAGLMFYLDGGDWLTLTLSQDKHVTLCVETQAKALPCVSRSGTGAITASTHDVWLRVSRQAMTYTGSYSVDGQTWTSVGQWTAGMPNSRTPASTTLPTASIPAPAATTNVEVSPTPTSGASSSAQIESGAAPLAFTEWGMYVVAAGGSSTLNVPVFTDFSVTAAPVNP